MIKIEVARCKLHFMFIFTINDEQKEKYKDRVILSQLINSESQSKADKCNISYIKRASRIQLRTNTSDTLGYALTLKQLRIDV